MRILALLATALALPELKAEDPQAIFTCEGDGFQNWKITGKAFGLGPRVELPLTFEPARGYCQESFASSVTGGLQEKGELLSPEFTLAHSYLSFRLGGLGEQTGVELTIDGEAVRRATPQASNNLQRVTWETENWVGQKVRLRIFDESEEGYLLFDHLVSHSYPNPIFPNPTREGQLFEVGLQASPAIPGLIIPQGFSAHIFADHEHQGVTSPTSLTVAPDGSVYLSETHRFRQGIADNRDHLYWLLDDIAARTVADRATLHHNWQHEVPLESLTEKSEIVRVLRDEDGDHLADKSAIFAHDLRDMLDGTASGVFAYEEIIYLACIPNIWALSDLDGDGKIGSEERVIIQDGFGVRISLSGHDLNGFTLGPDGRLYGSIGDRGLNLTTPEGVHYTLPSQGAAFRFDPDGTNFEIFHTGLRNPKEIAFNEFGDAFSVDNNADMGDSARLVYLVEGADSGWRSDHQNLHTFHREIGLEKRPLNPWMAERLWDTLHPGQPAFILPPLAHFSNGPSGLTFQPGTALGGHFENHFFLCDYKGGPSASGVHAFTLERAGASYQLGGLSKFVWGLGATDIDFGFDGTTYLTDFVTGWQSAPQGRVIALLPHEEHPQAVEVATLAAEGFRQRGNEELKSLLSHPDQRIRLRAQNILTERPEALACFYSILHLQDPLLTLAPENILLPPLDDEEDFSNEDTSLDRLHATWGLAMLARKDKNDYATAALLGLLHSPEPELRAQAAKALGEAPVKDPSRLIAALEDDSDRVRFFAALSLARLGITEAFDPLLTLAHYAYEKNDPYLRHAVVMAMTGCGTEQDLLSLSGHALPAMRMPVMLALHRLGSIGVNRFLFDHTPEIRHEAIRLIHDTPIEPARPALMAVLDDALAKETTTFSPLMWRRLLHSAFRLGTTAEAERLLAVAQTAHVPLSHRREALRLLQQWTQPHPVDQSIGRYAPQSPRSLLGIQPIIEKELSSLLQSESPLINEAVALIAHYEIGPQNLTHNKLLDLVDDEKIPTKARIIALKLLANEPDFVLSPLLLKILELKTSPPALSLAALEILTARNPQQSFSYLSQALLAPAVELRQGAAIQLASHPHPEVALLIVSYFDRLRENKNADRAIELEMTIAAQISFSFAAHEALKAYQTSLGDEPLLDHLGSLYGGNPTKGAELFASHPAAQCARCHSAAPNGGQNLAGPNLSEAGQNDRHYLLESLLDPSAAFASGDDFFLTLNNGEIISGTLIGETPESIDLRIAEATRQILRSDIASSQKAVSAMPAMGALVSGEDLRDLVAYLATLKKPSSIKKPLAQKPKRHHPSLP